MKLANIKIEGKSTFGVLKGDIVIDAHALQAPVIENTLAWINADEATKSSFQTAVENANVEQLLAENKAFNMIDDRIEFLPAVHEPKKIICVGHNFRTHILEMKREIPKYAMIFAKYHNVLAGHKEIIPIPEVSKEFDYEAELTVVIGKQAKAVSLENALDYVAGYTVANDLSVRDYQRRTIQFLQGKSFDKSGPIGPFMVTRDELNDVDKEHMVLRLNGQIMQETPLADMVFSVSDLVSQISEYMTLEPGDVILTGTPGGVGAARTPPVWIQHGDTIEVEITNVGVLRNSFRLPSKSQEQYPNIEEMKASLQADKQAFTDLLSNIGEQNLHTRPYTDSWTVAEAVAHITDAIDFFQHESIKALANPAEKVGRHKTNERRLARIAEHGADSAEQLSAQISSSIDSCLSFLEGLTDEDLAKKVQHKLPKFGEMELGSFLNHFVVGHSKAHLRQCLNLQNRFA
ncbi:2-keto-4-pentenoate hydratase/2-oxohepta-3-ene-1,7-dioic acid hydratase in catechol pathway [Arcicella aurantiaca]|uniref:2-keto-4-pentenoate hydratase/2-oxohepta-3-ene-1,7-dioic acid hydratase in catechol pathway n=1 Tax=Arcicella aurantiaca TaxID=591202 RepID=A0A316DHG1_9BACT|nr:fumarylacetoacetate hydrolase family protein [Arcicella aurantiaca]PWK17315.1 2-keto-4-pentenoate hydratase/2-oxohepta-3-ene-1,7-dioic acid hydratase in catechol pathway [Arcicella aurantiaca]